VSTAVGNKRSLFLSIIFFCGHRSGCESRFLMISCKSSSVVRIHIPHFDEIGISIQKENSISMRPKTIHHSYFVYFICDLTNWRCSVVVITEGSDPSDLGSNPGNA
jgi:hypothetical protein